MKLKAHITFQGGLGNQMFQFLFLNSIKKLGFEAFVDTSLYSKTKVHSGFILDSVFKVDLKQSKWSMLLSNNKFVKKFFSFDFGTKRVVTEETFDSNALENYSEIRFVGYWQSGEFVKKIYSNINKIFKFNNLELSTEGLSLLEKINSKCSVAIHIRKGDYVEKKNKDLYGLCSESYYYSSIELINSRVVGEKDFYVFSDDIEYSKNLLSNGFDFKFIEINNEVEELFLMHKCKHQIIANSTFSWWGATLNTNDNKVVVYPNPWYNKLEESIFIPKNWEPISKV